MGEVFRPSRAFRRGRIKGARESRRFRGREAPLARVVSRSVPSGDDGFELAASRVSTDATWQPARVNDTARNSACFIISLIFECHGCELMKVEGD